MFVTVLLINPSNNRLIRLSVALLVIDPVYCYLNCRPAQIRMWFSNLY